MGFRWKIAGDGICWQVGGDIPHYDDLEMSGRGVSYIVKYGVSEDGRLNLERYCVWPSLRRVPNDTHGSFQDSIQNDFVPSFYINDKPLVEYPDAFYIDGILTVHSKTANQIEITRQCFPSASYKNAYEIITLANGSSDDLLITVQGKSGTNSYGRGCKGVYLVETHWIPQKNEILLRAGEKYEIAVCISARTADSPWLEPDIKKELENRRKRIAELTEPLTLQTDDPALDTLFRFAKIRAGESIFDTMTGPLHSPGGYSYYAATWCNDEIEYAGPWFAMTGDPLAMKASVNAYMQYRPFMGPLYEHIPSSIISEGNDFWEGAGDRGDAAMYAYGASLFVLHSGSAPLAQKLWPGIEWCLEYCRRKTNGQGVVESDTDELEGRFPSGKANLSTSCLYYGGLVYGAMIAEALGNQGAALTYRREASSLSVCIEKYFGRNIGGYDTYRYYDGNTELRSWICLPLCMGILCRKEGTTDALFSEKLWTRDGLLTCENTSTVWDRSTLYGLKAGFLSGYGDRTMEYLKAYTRNRLLGERVPYPIEAYPEGGKRHLSGESALYCMTIVEGLIGLKPTAMNAFTFSTGLPQGIHEIVLKSIRAFGSCFDIEISAKGAKVTSNGKILWQGGPGDNAEVRFNR